ncbi:MAG: carbon-nitrogen hydrolase [Candidatus Dadabacteria bacterium]|nr:carbon-nitrogen hydrolase [Candidatus Dadabacteria bacterium]NIS08954.1 carbon-nitrogen hydrolase [Candidatus Dadabacteria bacterium]NIV41669.1 carbon-nitrogen hydrolase [Candidatus Dadabacteria bacterium]NIY21393.1 carbon-nitrogen hydrolase [Candidatus Dadabacteria bacterium]
MKAGFIQFAPKLGELDTNIKKIESFADQFKEADLLVMPELCNSGYNFKSAKQAFDTSEQIAKSEFVRFLESICKEYSLFIVSGFNERDGTDLYNSSVLIGPGGFIGKYRKLHLFMNEKKYFKPGNAGLPVFDIGICRVGMLVCFDWTFPEAWRILMLKKADIICHPSNLVLPGLCQRAIPIHSLTNRLYIVTANRIGTEDDLTFTGFSTISNPRGEILYQAKEDKEEVKIIDIDVSLARDKKITEMNDMIEDRRPELYTQLIIE